MLNLNLPTTALSTQAINAEVARIVWEQTSGTIPLPVDADTFYRYFMLENIRLAECEVVCNKLINSLVDTGLSVEEAEDKLYGFREVAPLWRLREQAKKNLTK